MRSEIILACLQGWQVYLSDLERVDLADTNDLFSVAADSFIQVELLRVLVAYGAVPKVSQDVRSLTLEHSLVELVAWRTRG